MVQQIINTGSAPDDNTGESIRDGFIKVNDNFTEVYGYLASGSGVGGVGFTGSKGDTGYTGSHGYTGSRGAGFTGSVGDTGFTGSAGNNGYTGSQGYTGSRGYSGSVGGIGSTGYTGSRGTQGYTGSRGFTGSTGYTGSTGSGYTGSRGTQGYTGSQGPAGGYTGSIGSTGYTGSKGDLGYTGSKGDNASPNTFTSGSSTPLTLSSAPSPAAAIDSMTITIAASNVSRNFIVNSTVVWASDAHQMRTLLTVDGTQVFPYAGGANYNGVSGNVDGDGKHSSTFSGVVITIPGDNASHTIAMAWEASGSLAGFILYDRWISVIQTNDGSIGNGYTGSKGDTGYTGSQGPAGGYTGSKGDKGDIGYTGSVGIAPGMVIQSLTAVSGPTMQIIYGNTPQPINGLSVDFTPLYANSKILISANIVNSQNYVAAFGVYKDGSPTISYTTPPTPDTIVSGQAISLSDTRKWVSPIYPITNTSAYDYYKIIFPTLKDTANANSMQIAEVEFFDASDNKITDLTDYAATSKNDDQSGRGIDRVHDDNPDTKYLNFDKENSGFWFKTNGTKVIAGVRFTTGDDATPRDPASFTLYGSNEQTSFSFQGYKNDCYNNMQVVNWTGLGSDKLITTTVTHVETSGSTTKRTYRMYGLSAWQNSASTLWINNRSNQDMASFSHMTVMEIAQ